jgi:hypothetical protein
MPLSLDWLSARCWSFAPVAFGGWPEQQLVTKKLPIGSLTRRGLEFRLAEIDELLRIYAHHGRPNMDTDHGERFNQLFSELSRRRLEAAGL